MEGEMEMKMETRNSMQPCKMEMEQKKANSSAVFCFFSILQDLYGILFIHLSLHFCLHCSYEPSLNTVGGQIKTVCQMPQALLCLLRTTIFFMSVLVHILFEM